MGISRDARLRIGGMTAWRSATALGAVLLTISACSAQHDVSAQPDPKTQLTFQSGNGMGGKPVDWARFVQSEVPDHIAHVVDVTGAYPARHVAGAFVLIDRSVGATWAPDDYEHRPLFVVFDSVSAATHAVQSKPGAHQAGTHVLFLPQGFPGDLSHHYIYAASVTTIG